LACLRRVPEFGKNNNFNIMKKVILTYGLIMGAIIGAMLLISIPMWKNGTLNFDNGELVGYTSMVVASSLIFFGIKSFRDNYSGGAVTFWQGTKVGLLITLVSCIVYAAAWQVSYHYMDGDFLQKMTEHRLAEMKAEGATEVELEETRATWESFGEMYKNPFIRFVITMFEPLPVALFFVVVSAGLLRRKDFLPSEPNVTSAVH